MPAYAPIMPNTAIKIRSKIMNQFIEITNKNTNQKMFMNLSCIQAVRELPNRNAYIEFSEFNLFRKFCHVVETMESYCEVKNSIKEALENNELRAQNALKI